MAGALAAKTGLGVGKFLFSKFGIVASALTAGLVDQKWNEGKGTKAVLDKGVEVAGSAFKGGSDLAFRAAKDRLDKTVGGFVDRTFGEGSQIGDFFKGNWGKLIFGGLSLGLFANKDTRMWGLMMGVGLVALTLFQHHQNKVKNDFSEAAAVSTPAPAAKSALDIRGATDGKVVVVQSQVPDGVAQTQTHAGLSVEQDQPAPSVENT